MSDHRRLQRTLFRMQLDPGFAEALRGGDPHAAESTGLLADDLVLLLEADPAGISADFDGRRRAQFLGNVASEFLLTTWTAVQGEADPELVESFTASAQFHRAAAADRPFPLAFAAHAAKRAEAASDPALAAFAELEGEMARARRELAVRPDPGPGRWRLPPTVRLLEAPRGTFEAAAALRAALDAGREPERPVLPGDGTEPLLLHATSAPSERRRAEVAVEPLGELPAALLRLAEEGLGASGREAFCLEQDVALEELADFARELAGDGLLLLD